MKTRATKFFKSYFKIHDEDMELYDDTIDCLVKFAESEVQNVNDVLSWIEKDRLAGIRLNEIMELEAKESILNEVSGKVLRQLIIEGINIGLKHR